MLFFIKYYFKFIENSNDIVIIHLFEMGNEIWFRKRLKNPFIDPRIDSLIEKNISKWAEIWNIKLICVINRLNIYKKKKSNNGFGVYLLRCYIIGCESFNGSYM